MRIGMIGLGKLGLPVALAIESRGHEVIGYDINPKVEEYIRRRKIPYKEKGIQPLLNSTKLHVAKSITEVMAESDIIFLAIQTPHGPEFEGSTRLPNTRRDFNYTYLVNTLVEVAASGLNKPVAVISTCLPGTYKNQLSKFSQYCRYVYTPQFIAMGNVIEDYLNPEFNLIGVENEEAAELLEKFYKTINNAPCLKTDITTAEAIKVSYNTFITMKTVLGNTWGELCHKTGANVDDVFKAWALSTKRLLSPSYLKSGVGDGGGCHPRDNIALSYIAEELDLSHNLFEDLMTAREDHMEWLAEECMKYGDKITILGRSFKPETNIETGSPAILLANILKDKGARVQHIEYIEDAEYAYDPVVIIGTQHERYKKYNFWPGITVIDPFRYLPKSDKVNIISIGDPNDRRGNS